MKVAIVADWLTDFGGAERVILQLHKIFPKAKIFTSVYNPETMKDFVDAEIETSFIQKLPKAKSKHQMYITLMPLAFEHMDLSDYDIVISSAHSCAKGVITKPQTVHICYCHSPMRYVWDNCHEYIKSYNLPGFVKRLAQCPLHKLRQWDRLAADRVDHYIANSKETRKRIKKYYNRDSEVIYPPVDLDRFKISSKIGDHFIAIGRLIPYKRFDLTVEAANQLGIPLKVLGTGSELEKLKSMANKNVEFPGRVSDAEAARLLSSAKALIFPQLEDFGITPLEAMACGRPVIAYKAGGALETVTPKTGIFFKEQTVDALKIAILKFIKDENKFNPNVIRKHAEKFSPFIFNKKIVDFIHKVWT